MSRYYVLLYDILIMPHLRPLLVNFGILVCLEVELIKFVELENSIFFCGLEIHLELLHSPEVPMFELDGKVAHIAKD